MPSNKQVLRTTMFKIPKKEDQHALTESYVKLRSEATKDGKPYIISCSAGPTYDDSRSQGYTFLARCTFASKEDMDFYDTECEAHKQLKAGLKSMISEPTLVVYYQDALDDSTEFLKLN